MEHAQLIANLDGSLCLDVYTEMPFSGTSPEQTANICKYVEAQTGKTIRRHPFRLGKCSNCGHWIISNRDSNAEFHCQNCHRSTVLLEYRTQEARYWMDQFTQELGIKMTSAAGTMAHMLILMPDNRPDIDGLNRILNAYGFSIRQDLDSKFASLYSFALAKGWMKENTLPIYCTAPLGDDDCYYENLIPRIEECDRMIRKAYQGVYTLSDTSFLRERTHTSQRSRKDRINDLVAEGKLEEAYQLLSCLDD